jgi:hypothetical protein
MADRLRPLWNFDDLDASEQRLRLQLEREASDSGRAEVLTQLARVEGLRGNFNRCAQLLAEAEPLAGLSTPANVRLDLERGRMYRSSGDPQSASCCSRAHSDAPWRQASTTSPAMQLICVPFPRTTAT